VTSVNWAGVLLITTGATLVGYGEAAKEEMTPPWQSVPLSHNAGE
jgi:hypothetical protein